MNKTLFAGLTQLDPGESLSTDNASFQSENPPKIDRLLEIGAVTHRHNAHAAQVSPGSTAIPGASAVASGGFIPADLAVYVGFTLRDFDQGETLISPIATVSTDTPLESPSDAPDVEADYTAGGLVADTYYYAISLLDAEGGETPIGPTSAVEREPGYASGRVLVSGLLAPVLTASAAAWRLWRGVGGGDLFYIASGATDTFVDDGSECVDCTLGPVDPDFNLTNGDNSILVEVPSGGAMLTASAFSVYLSTDPAFDGPSLAATYPIASAGQILTFRDLIVEDHRPPDVSTCIPGASQIDPDTELLDWHWKRPVAGSALLPVDAEEGDVRVTLDDGVPWRFVSGAWGQWAMGGGGGIAGIEVDDGITFLEPVDELHFVGSAGTIVTVTASGASGATITIEGEPGPPGSGGSIGVTGDDLDPTVLDSSSIWFTPGQGLQEEVIDNGGGQALVSYGLTDEHFRVGQRGYVTWAGSAVAASGDVIVDNFPDLGKAYTLFTIGTSCALRVRIYASPDFRDADISRPIGTPPTGNHGLVFEFIGDTSAGMDEWIVPGVSGAHWDAGEVDPTTPNVAITVENLDTSQTPSVAITRVLMQG